MTFGAPTASLIGARSTRRFLFHARVAPPSPAPLTLPSPPRYQALFTELDEDASGSIDADEIGLLVQAMTGETMDEDKLQAMVDEVDKDGSGVIEWDEFLIIMDGIKNGKKMGLGDLLGSALKDGFKRSVVGKGFAKASNWYNRKKIEMEEMMNQEAKEQREAEERKRTAEKYWEAEKIKRERLRQEAKLLNAMANG